MAFVFRQQRKTFYQVKNRDVGPGTYQTVVQNQSKIPKIQIPFGTTVQRLNQANLKQPTPGPGSYQIDKPNTSQKVVVSSATEDIKILEVAKPLSIFKSTTKRFDEIIQQTPGPGQYYKQVRQTKTANQYKVQDSKPKIIQHLIKINKYQSIPSIPSNIHAYGYNQNQKNELQLNQPPQQLFKGEKNDTVGPGQYNIQAADTRKRGVTWHKSKVNRTQQPKPNPIGPGSYDIRPYNPIFHYKPSSQFASTTLRNMDQRKGAIVNKVIQQKMNLTQKSSRIMSQKPVQSTHMDSDEEYQYIDDSTPGPGSYLKITQQKKYRAGKNTHFGTKSRRFQQLNQQKNLVGPGQYLKSEEKTTTYYRRKKIPFGGIKPRFVDQTEGNVPGPGSYEPRNALQDRLIFKIQRGYRGQFGTTQQRFKQPMQNKVGPGYYNYSEIKQYQEGAENAAFKSKVNKGILSNQKDLNPPPGAYQLNYFDIAKNAIKQQQEDPDLIIKKPGFNVGSKRFKYEMKKQDPFDDDDILHQIQLRARQQQKNKKNNAPFNSKQPRLAIKQKDIPGPGIIGIKELLTSCLPIFELVFDCFASLFILIFSITSFRKKNDNY